jgi:hypothetical protein
VINLLDESLRRFLRGELGFSEDDVDVTFDAPDRDWAARVTRSTINLFLWDVRRNLSEAESGSEIVTDAAGVKTRRPPLPRVDCRYLITAWTSDVTDEHEVLGDVLRVLLLNSTLREEYCEPAIAALRPLPSLRAALPDTKDTSDFWSALGGQLKPGLDLMVTAVVPAVPVLRVGRPVEKREVQATPMPDRVAAPSVLDEAAQH